MSDLRFDTGADEFGAPRVQQQGNDISSKLVEWGLVSTRQEALYILVGVAIVLLAFAAFWFWSNAKSYPTQETTQTIIYN